MLEPNIEVYRSVEPWKNFKNIIGHMLGDANGDNSVDEVDAQLILDVSVGNINLSDLAVPVAVEVPGGNTTALEVNAQLVLDYSVATEKPW